jgi:DNA replication protein DnaC
MQDISIGDKKTNYKTSNVNNQLTQPHYQAQDYFSIMSAFQQMLVQRQMEFQESLTKLLRINNPTAKLILALTIMHPRKAMGLGKSNIILFISILKYLLRYSKSILYRKPPPKKVTLEVSYINENQINHLYMAFDWYLKSNCKPITDVDYSIVTLKSPIDPSKLDKDYGIQKSQPQETTTEILYKNYTISFSKTSKDEVIYAPSGEMKKKNYIITLWSYECKLDLLENLCQYVANQYAKSKIDEVWSQKMYKHEDNQWKSTSMERNKRKLSTVVLKNGQSDEFKKSLDHYIHSEEFYLERGIPYKQSYLFYGPPGTGKTSMIKALSFEVKRHIHYLSLSNIESDQQLNHLMSNIIYNETIVILEDVDAMSTITHNRKKTVEADSDNEIISLDDDNKNNKKNKKEEPKGVTLSGLLNQIDGVNDHHGMILVMTTNHPEKLDEALIRDGRVDQRILFDYCDHEQIFEMFTNFYNGKIEVTLNDITKINLEKTKIAPCSVENIMKKNYKNSKQALLELLNIEISGKPHFEKF